MIPVALFFLIIGTEDGRPKRPIVTYAPFVFLALLPTGKVADNRNRISDEAMRQMLSKLIFTIMIQLVSSL
jgi:hypothetical protein